MLHINEYGIIVRGVIRYSYKLMVYEIKYDFSWGCSMNKEQLLKYIEDKKFEYSFKDKMKL